ncbi:MAG: FAD-dependent oxidoreductase [Candidatus Heimdallarchaeota archaeon]|nr:FAD-dependent oxidoreductase [Candidatus Heimdallarchaeota archaeon]
MVEKIESDILVEGEGITAVALAYFLSKYKTDSSINLVLREQKGLNLSHFNPGIILPIFQLPDSLMSAIFQRNITILEELNTITKDFEFSQNPLVLLYRDKNSIAKMNLHQEKLEGSTISHKNLNLEETESYFPFIKTEKEIHLTEIHNSYTCSNPFDLFTSFQKLAEENDVYIIREKERISIKNKRILSTASTDYSGRDLVFTTSNYNQHPTELRTSNLVKVITPIFERFPKINLFDASTASFMWLEEAGYFHIFRSSDKKRESLESIESDFDDIFSFSGKLEILDASYKKLDTINTIDNSLGYMNDKEIFYLNIPPHFELSLSPLVSDRIARLNDEKLEILKQPKAIFKIFEK